MIHLAHNKPTKVNQHACVVVIGTLVSIASKNVGPVLIVVENIPLYLYFLPLQYIAILIPMYLSTTCI